MLNVLSVTGAVFVLIGLGYLSVRFSVLKESDLTILSKYLLNIALPALLLNAIATRHFDEIFDTAYFSAYAFSSLTAFGFGLLASRVVLKKTGTAATFVAMGTSASNSGFIGFPVLNMIMPTVAPIALALNMVVENVLMLPITLTLAERPRGGVPGWALARQIVLRLATNPIIIAIVAGLAISVASIDLPRVISVPIGLLAASASAPSLIIIGGSLAHLPKGSASPGIALIAFGKLFLHPAATILALTVLADYGIEAGSTDLHNAAIIMAALPQMGLYAILAHHYGEGKTAALATFVSTLVSFASLSFLLWYLGTVTG